MSETITAEEKAAQIFDASKPVDYDLTDLDEFNILENKGIEYVMKKEGKEDLKIYVRPLTLSEHSRILEMQDKFKNMKELEAIKVTLDIFSKFFNMPAEILADYMTQDDITSIFALFACALYEGKKLFKKKKLPKEEYQLAISTIKTAIMNHGLLTI
jgi:hypothetical protein